MISRHLFLAFLFVIFTVGNSFSAEKETDKKIKKHYTYNKKNGKPKIFVEGVKLDFDFMRRNMKFVDFVNDPAVSDVHIIITSRKSGSGGKVYSLMYSSKTFTNISDFTISCSTTPSDTHDEIRKTITDAITLGLMPYINQTEVSKNIVIRYNENNKAESAQPVQTEDPWNSWTFRGDIVGSIDLEESKQKYNYSYNLRADHVTEEWKSRTMGRMSVRKQEYERNDKKYKSENVTNYVTTSLVNSLAPRWSVGGSFSYYSSNYMNLIHSFLLQPAIEYNIFPWDISDRKVFTLAYYVGRDWRKYHEETIYGVLEESLWSQSLRVDLQLVQTWGEIEAGLKASNYLHDFSKNRISFDSDLSIRVFRGLSVNFKFRAENIHDQIYLPKSEASLEDVLLNRVKLPSSFEVYTGFGIRVQFGSIYNNVVNNRL